jgi:tRNA dimethylallyltransferase
MGPTASGKSDLAIRLARRHPFEIISVDSTMVYRGLDIGTAEPGPLMLREIPHHLIDICDPVERYSAARFREDALAAISAIHARAKIPLLVGGTGLYFRVLERGISKLPEADPTVRARLQQERDVHGSEHMHKRLAAVDPEAADRIHPNDPQRILRALEIWELTGQPMSYLQRRAVYPPIRFPVAKMVVAAARGDVLRQRVASRFQRMLEQGLVNEVLALKKRADLTSETPAVRSVGYREVWRYLDGEFSYKDMVDKAVVSTCRLAKRQYTWLRAEINTQWFDSENSKLLNEFESFAAKHQILKKD